MNIYSVESRTRRYQVFERIVTRAFILAVALFQQLLVFCFLFGLFDVLANQLGDLEFSEHQVIRWTAIKIAKAETTLHNLPIQVGLLSSRIVDRSSCSRHATFDIVRQGSCESRAPPRPGAACFIAPEIDLCRGLLNTRDLTCRLQPENP